MSSSNLPAPPVLKTTIIQLNKDLDHDGTNYEILTNDYNDKAATAAAASPTLAPKKKRRRSNSNVNAEELAKRKFETKQLHSIIEKRRRIKINREFEALKYLIPACRNGTAGAGSPATPARDSNSKIDGMYKLTILKSSVEYILYLHHLIQKQQELIERANPGHEFDLTFTKTPLNVNEYRNIDKDFNFKQLIDIEEHPEADAEMPPPGPSSASSSNADNDDDFQLPSPMITPNIEPAGKYELRASQGRFELPDPALGLRMPAKRMFKQVPKTLVLNQPDSAESDASKTLLALRKSNIDALLN